MERRIQEIHGSFTVVIPRELAQSIGLRKGSRVRFTEVPTGLLIQSPNGRGRETVFTIGYAGRSPEAFSDVLLKNDVEQLVDVRELPLSRKRSFSKTSIAKLLSKQGVEYFHIRDLGSPRAARRELRSGGSFEDFREEYFRHLDQHQIPFFALVGLARTRRTAIMCVEASHEECHRGMLAARMEELGLQVNHL